MVDDRLDYLLALQHNVESKGQKLTRAKLEELNILLKAVVLRNTLDNGENKTIHKDLH